ncbi:MULTISPECIES: TetR family transcriptional regulator C-terminal domain-containing protein [Roseinatronobacter]|uniref:TetR family transcriptional regulator C-terminal domain-containing protein n=1 Tax=Roseinatronobacter domitianus TaxID=2940293 RepID=A0ABT0M2A3_9RHOB|nr:MULTISPECIES: TetR family transcriptional regulator C-terminal domain-containing protein [Roseibaca]MCL1628997.1 TetR family transcriptional regulator C-terminal domain-containing protein [Roseibaca domitiana]
MTSPRKVTRIQREKREVILAAALEAFAEDGLRGATLEKIADKAGMSKPHVVYYFGSKDAIYTDLLQSLLEVWVQPLRDLSEDADPLAAILTYMRRKLRMSQDMPRESKMFATEILHGAPRMRQQLSGDLKSLVDEKAALIARWSAEGKIAKIDPHHLIFSIWAMTQHYADFDIQVEAVLGDDRKAGLYDEADAFLTEFFVRALRP